jgi:hypothetical protein
MALDLKEPFDQYEGRWVTDNWRRLIHLIHFVRYNEVGDSVIFKAEDYGASKMMLGNFILTRNIGNYDLLDNKEVIKTIWQILE